MFGSFSKSETALSSSIKMCISAAGGGGGGDGGGGGGGGGYAHFNARAQSFLTFGKCLIKAWLTTGWSALCCSLIPKDRFSSVEAQL